MVRWITKEEHASMKFAPQMLGGSLDDLLTSRPGGIVRMREPGAMIYENPEQLARHREWQALAENT